MWQNLHDLQYNTVKLRSEFLPYHSAQLISAKPVLDITNIKDSNELLREIYSKINGLVFGEEHFDNVSTSFLINNMEILAQLGVDTLFFEGLFYNLERGIDGLSEEERNTHPEYSGLIQKAKECGIKVIGIDSKGCKRGDGITRGVFMNAYAASIINNTHKNKWLVLTGMMHINDDYFIDSITKNKHIIRGISELTGAFSVILHSVSENEDSYIKVRETYMAWPGKYVIPDCILGIHAYKRVQDSYRNRIITNPVYELYKKIKSYGWEISYYDIDSFARFDKEKGYITGVVFGLRNLEKSIDNLLSHNRTICSNLLIDNDNNEVVFMCDLNELEQVTNNIERVVSTTYSLLYQH